MSRGGIGVGANFLHCRLQLRRCLCRDQNRVRRGEFQAVRLRAIEPIHLHAAHRENFGGTRLRECQVGALDANLVVDAHCDAQFWFGLFGECTVRRYQHSCDKEC
jgi:hypothetical protein